MDWQKCPVMAYLKLGWKHKIDIEDGLTMVYASFAANHTNKNVTEDSTFERQTI